MASPPRSAFSAVSMLRRIRRVTHLQLAAGVLVGFLITSIVGGSGEFFILLLLSMPVVAFFAHISRIQATYDIRDRDVAQLLVTFCGGIFPSALIATVFECVLAPLLAVLCFYDQQDTLLPQLRSFLDKDQSRTSGSSSSSPPHSGRVANVLETLDIQKTFGYYLFMVLVAFVVAGLVEEATKLWVVHAKCLCNCSSTRQWFCDPRRLLFKRVGHPNHYVVVVLGVVSAALGFSFIENVAYSFAMPTGSDRFHAAVLRSILSTPLHCVCGALTGIRLASLLVTRSPAPTEGGARAIVLMLTLKKKLWVLCPAVLVHGSFDLQLLIVSSVVSDAAAAAHPVLYDVVVPTVLTLLVLGAGYQLCRSEWSKLSEMATTQSGPYAPIDGHEAAEDEDDSDDSDDEEDDTTAYKRSAQGMLLV